MSYRQDNGQLVEQHVDLELQLRYFDGACRDTEVTMTIPAPLRIDYEVVQIENLSNTEISRQLASQKLAINLSKKLSHCSKLKKKYSSY